MKKLFAILLALVIVCSLGVTAFAEDSTVPGVSTSNAAKVENGGSFTIVKEYNVTGTAPAETFTFTVSEGTVKDSDDVSAPAVTVNSVEFDGTKTETKNVTVNLPTYSVVGEYHYTISETASTNAGVTTQQPLTLIVYVVNGENGLECYVALKDKEGNKVDGFTGNLANKYDSGSLAVSKKVTGNMGDKTKKFNVTVTFTNEKGASTISYVEGTESKTINFVNGSATATIALKDSETITFTNIPAGTTYTVSEADYTGNNGGYEAATYTYSDDEKTISANDADTVEITNNKNDANINTGVSLDSLPYVVVLAVALLGAVVLFTRKRVNE